MGSGCSSPLKRLGGKRGKSRRESSLYGEQNGDNADRPEDQPALSVSESCRPKQSPDRNKQFFLENEITIQSEINEDHPSTASYYTDGKNHNEETKGSEQSTSLDPKSMGTNSSTALNSNCGGAVARMMGFRDSFTPHDRHLLVSPALSPAPSTCYSPSPATSLIALGCDTTIDLVDLNEALKTITFNHPNQPNNKIKQTERHRSELHDYYAQHLVQSKNDFEDYISVVFIASETFQNFTKSNNDDITSSNQDDKQNGDGNAIRNASNICETVGNHIESSLKTFCDEHLFNSKFLNLSQEHLSQYFHVNNLLEASMSLLEKEYSENGQRLILIVFSSQAGIQPNSSNHQADTPKNNKIGQGQPIDKRLLPTKIEAQSMIKLRTSLNETGSDESKELLKKWYNQVGGPFYLNPIYLVYPNILSEVAELRDQAWRDWLRDSNNLIQLIRSSQEKNTDLVAEIKLKPLFSSQLDFILREQPVQKRTLLIRNYTQPLISNQLSTQQSQPQHTKDGSLNELSKLLADSNKLSLKRPLTEEEVVRNINDWVMENLNKFVEGILEDRIVHGKHIPPFIERNLFIELTCQRHHFESYLESIAESFETKSANFYVSQISPIIDSVIRSSGESSAQETAPEMDKDRVLQAAQQRSTNHLVFISGPRGCGKSTLFAQIIRQAAEAVLNKAQIIYRFCGVTLDSSRSNRLLRSICEQFCQSQGENITAASYIYSSRAEVIDALNKIIKSQLSFIFLDGLDMYSESFDEDLDWLCEIEANPRIKIFITLEMNSRFYNKALSTYSDATFITLDHPSIAEWAQMLVSIARSRRLNSAGNLYDDIKNLETPESKNCNLTFSDSKDIIRICRIRKLNNESLYPELSVKSIRTSLTQSSRIVHQTILSHLHYIMTPIQMSSLVTLLGSSRSGYHESDIMSLMNVILQSLKSATPADHKFPAALFNYLKIHIEPWILRIYKDKRFEMALCHDFITNAIEYYSSIYPNIVNEVREILADHFSRQSQPRSSKGNIFKTADNIPLDFKENISVRERSWLAIQSSELSHLILLTNPSKIKDHNMSKNHFYQQMFYTSMPEELIEDYERYKSFLTSNKKAAPPEELVSLVNYIRQSIYPLRYDGCQIFSQIYCRAYDHLKSGKFSKNKKLNDIISAASCPPVNSLLPISEASINSFIKTRIGTAQSGNQLEKQPSGLAQQTMGQKLSKPTTSSYGPQAGGQQLIRRKIFTINDNHRHVIVIYPDKGMLSVWDIFEERAVRTIHNIDQPRDVKMIDHKRAVVLCNRELRVYDLDSGIMITKLKGVMNQKMPFYGVFGENYVVALARNRMYVNMMNINTGELETTFKVGEDRFLNSLLVSANAGICVCGDETQKPFPLLVWNLNERRLMYDLRLDRHEFITRMSAISDNGQFVVSVCRHLGDSDVSTTVGQGSTTGGSVSNSGNKSSLPNFIVIYDLNSGTLFKKWKPGLDSCAVAISVSANRTGQVINTIVDSSILVWDLATGSKKHTLIGHTAPADVIRVQNNRLFSMDSTCRDQSLRIWDIEEGYCLSVFSSDAPINCCQMSIRGDALVCAFGSDTRLSTLVMCKNETVNDVVKRNKRRKSSKSLYIFDEPPSRKASS